MLASALALLFSSCRTPRDEQVDVADLVYDRRYGEPFVHVVNADLAVDDYCTACHVFDAPSALPDLRSNADAWRPAAARRPGDPPWLVRSVHPGGYLSWHESGEFGCTSCHGGDGSGLSYTSAHHGEMLVSEELEARCGVCHSGDYVPAAPRLSAGRQLIQQHNCSGCHAVSQQLRSRQTAPDLTHASTKLLYPLLRVWPNVVHDFKDDARMPRYNLGDEVLDQLEHYLVSLDETELVLDANILATQEGYRERGLELIRTARCANCHILPRGDEADEDDLLWSIPQGTVGPDLRFIAERTDEYWIENYLKQTHAWYPYTRMPQYQFSPGERLDIAGYLMEVSAEELSRAGRNPELPERPGGFASWIVPEKGMVAAGRSQFVGLGCSGCHTVADRAVATRPVGASLELIGEKPLDLLPAEAQDLSSLQLYFYATLLDPASTGNELMPQYRLTKAERTEMTIALLAEREPPHEKYRRQFSLQRFDFAQLNAAIADDSRERIDTLLKEYWQHPVPPQGSGPPQLSAGERDLHPASCATCHREQYEQWKESRHALAMGPGVTGQLIEWASERPAEYFSCLRCHAPQSEQSHVRAGRQAGTWEANPHVVEALYDVGLSCTGCHVRAHVRTATDPQRELHRWDSASVSAHPLERSRILKDSTFCKDCHQFPPEQGLAGGGPPLENTFAEWQAWRRQSGDQRSCQDCHMPNGVHSFRGIRDEGYVRDSLDIEWEIDQHVAGIAAKLLLRNRDNGHHFPTYVTPRVFVRFYFVDSDGDVLVESFNEHVIGRDARSRPRAGGDGHEWYDVSDTRIPAGAEARFSYDERLPANASEFRLEVFVAPDHFYHGAYGRWIKDESRSSAGIALLEEARRETKPGVSGYYILKQSRKIER